jgi:hypothetical protein
MWLELAGSSYIFSRECTPVKLGIGPLSLLSESILIDIFFYKMLRVEQHKAYPNESKISESYNLQNEEISQVVESRNFTRETVAI